MDLDEFSADFAAAVNDAAPVPTFDALYGQRVESLARRRSRRQRVMIPAGVTAAASVAVVGVIASGMPDDHGAYTGPATGPSATSSTSPRQTSAQPRCFFHGVVLHLGPRHWRLPPTSGLTSPRPVRLTMHVGQTVTATGPVDACSLVLVSLGAQGQSVMEDTAHRPAAAIWQMVALRPGTAIVAVNDRYPRPPGLSIPSSVAPPRFHITVTP